MSPLSESVASGMTAPTLVPAALFSATSRVAVVGENTGALLVTGVSRSRSVTKLSEDQSRLASCHL